jgi:hypothetical protein
MSDEIEEGAPSDDVQGALIPVLEQSINQSIFSSVKLVA